MGLFMFRSRYENMTRKFSKERASCFCVKCHKGTAGSTVHSRLCVCFSFQHFAKIRLTVVRTSEKLSSKHVTAIYQFDCVLSFLESVLLKLLFFFFLMFVVMSQMASNIASTLAISPHQASSPAHPVSLSHCCPVYAYF